ncbi:MAG: metallophosphoesterase [Actinomycetota bacterium]|nr:metallophosphoesterase [Actinomycetota bacterium]
MIKRIGKVLLVVFLAAVVVYAGLAIYAYSYLGGIPTAGAKYPESRIRQIIWPTIGYPALTSPGGNIVVEMDVSGVSGKLSDSFRWRGTVSASRKELKGLSYELSFVRAWKGASKRWTLCKHRKISPEVINVEFQVPSVACELYDLEVEAIAGKAKIRDDEPHCVGVVPKLDDSFRFMTLADVHVHERGISALLQSQTDAGVSPEGEPLYFYDAMDQVNLVRPEFAVILGDCIFAQRRAGEMLSEFERFYEALSRLEVPVFILPGNHDLYVNRVDGERLWEENIGPLCYSFDQCSCHFTAFDTYDWPERERVVMRKAGNVFVYARKWQGQVRGARDERKPETYTGELAWLREDLRKSVSAKLRIVFLHHCPYTPSGKGISYKNERFAGVFTLGGNGTGARALRELFSRYRVHVVMSGHLHEDNYGCVEWKDGTGKTIYANQTCVYFDHGGVQNHYPGYRLVEVKDGKIGELSYLTKGSSYPFYDGSKPGGMTDNDALEKPATEARRIETSGGTLVWKVKNFLGKPVTLDGLIALVQVGGRDVMGAEVTKETPLPDGNMVLVNLRVKLKAGKHSTSKGGTEPYVTTVVLRSRP